MSDPAYVLGHSSAELERLSRQHRLIGGFTRRLFLDAGLAGCRRVLDLGSGAGDVSFLARELIAADGEVIGVDREARAVARATQRAAALDLSGVSFCEGDPVAMAFEQPFDAVVGRYVLLFQADPAAWLGSLRRHLKPGGLIVLHEPDFHDLRSIPPVPSYDRCCHWVSEAFDHAGTPVTMACTLSAVFAAAGLPTPTLRLETAIGAGDTISDWLEALAELAGSLQPAMQRFGVVSEADLDLATLAERMRRDVRASGAVVFGRSELGAWCRLPDAAPAA